jgi:hypothetical protein
MRRNLIGPIANQGKGSQTALANFSETLSVTKSTDNEASRICYVKIEITVLAPAALQSHCFRFIRLESLDGTVRQMFDNRAISYFASHRLIFLFHLRTQRFHRNRAMLMATQWVVVELTKLDNLILIGFL